jgi:hypothetical protein
MNKPRDNLSNRCDEYAQILHPTKHQPNLVPVSTEWHRVFWNDQKNLFMSRHRNVTRDGCVCVCSLAFYVCAYIKACAIHTFSGRLPGITLAPISLAASYAALNSDSASSFLVPPLC